MVAYLWLILPGLALGIYATLVGAGGGFVLMPFLLLLEPNPGDHGAIARITSISMLVVLVNTLSGTFAYGRMKRIDFRAAVPFALAALPGALLGTYLTHRIMTGPFQIIFGVVLLGASALLFFNPEKEVDPDCEGEPRDNGASHRHVDGEGRSYTYTYNRKLGTGLSFIEGLFSSVLGIGGGIVHVPVLVHVLNFPAHIATATSQFIAASIALTSVLVHLYSGDIRGGGSLYPALALGVAVGAQIGARLSKRVHARHLLRLLSLGLGFVGLMLLRKGVLHPGPAVHR